jgi:hypothetical protein
MTVRDYWVDDLKCPRCGKTAKPKPSQADGHAFLHGKTLTIIDEIPAGFGYGMRRNAITFFCKDCKVAAK